MTDQANSIQRKEIELAGRKLPLVIASPQASSQQVLAELEIPQPEAVFLLSGQALSLKDRLKPRLKALFSRGVLKAAKGRQVVILTGGTQYGVMEQMGLAATEQAEPVTLLGVAPTAKAIYPGGPDLSAVPDAAVLDPNHSHFVLPESQEWGGETRRMFDLAEALVSGGVNKRVPVITILAGGGFKGVALQEALHTVRHGWPILVIEGSGELADEIARLRRLQQEKNRLKRWLRKAGFVLRRSVNADLRQELESLSEIVEGGRLLLFPKKRKPADLERLLTDTLKVPPPDSILLRAWKRFALYDLNAARHQNDYRILRSWPLILGVVSTAAVLLQQQLSSAEIFPEGHFWYQILRIFIILVPIVAALFLAAERLFKSGNKWLMLRFYAEGIKGDIYSYRVLSALNPLGETRLPDEPNELAERLTDFSRRLMRTEANESALRPYTGPNPPAMFAAEARDDGFSPLTPQEYLRIRIDDQLNYYIKKTNKLEKQLRPRQWWILIFGAAGALLAALGGYFQLWLPLTVSLVSAITAYLEYQQVEQSLVKYNGAMTSLNNISDRWKAIQERGPLTNPQIISMVEEVERQLQSEFQGWVQQMQVAQVSQQAPSGVAEKGKKS